MMKTFRLIGMAFVVMCLCMNFASCSNEDVLATEDSQEEKYVTVGLGCTGEFLEFSDSPLSRTTTEELYGIQVYALTPVYMCDDPETGEALYSYESTPYAYGMFTSLDDVTIRLLKEQKYKFEVSVVIDPFKNTSEYHYQYDWFMRDYNEYLSTYRTEFAYTSQYYITPSNIERWEHSSHFVYDRYYGELDEYTPQENVSVDIYTKRVAYGVRYETTGLADGESLTVEVSKDIYDNLYSVVLDSEINEGIYTFQSITSVWYRACNGSTNYASDKKLTITWNKADGTEVPMGTYNVTFKRNVMTTIRIKAENLNMDNGIKVFKEEVAMVPDDNVYEIERGTVTEVPVASGN